MEPKKRVTISKLLSKTLRHAPETLGLTLEEGGWVLVEALLIALEKKGHALDRAGLEEVVATNDKQRFALSEDGLRIRANQGHSVEVDLGYTAQLPPDFLYHGTGLQNRASIEAQGILRGKRHHVHLSADKETAIRVGSRHGKPYVFVVQAGRMANAGFVFYRSENGVWLTDFVPPDFCA